MECSASSDAKQDIITIIGTRTGVDEAKAMLEKMVKELALIEEKEVTVPEQYHKEFTQRRAELINKISGDCGGVQISFPRAPKVRILASNVLLIRLKLPAGNVFIENIDQGVSSM